MSEVCGRGGAEAACGGEQGSEPVRIKTLRASGTRVIAEVVVGVRDNGNNVVIRVDMDRKDEAVVAAMAMLDNVLLREAQEQIRQAGSREAVEERATQLAGKQIRQAQERAERASLATLREVLRIVEGTWTGTDPASTKSAIVSKIKSKVEEKEQRSA